MKTNNKTRHKAPRTIITNKKEITKHNMKTKNEEQRTRSLKPKKKTNTNKNIKHKNPTTNEQRTHGQMTKDEIQDQRARPRTTEKNKFKKQKSK